MEQERDINLLRLRSDEQRKLEAAGITSLEQIALMSRYDLGLGKQRGDAIIQTAQNILANRHITAIKLNLNEIPRKINLLTNREDQIFSKIISKMWYAETYGCKVERIDHGFSIVEGAQPFDQVVKQIEQFRDILELKAVEEYREKGITLPREDIVIFARERGFDHFWKTVFEEIRGNELMKKCIACGIFSSPFEPVHVLIVGDPASAKTMAKDVLSQNFSDIQLVGANATKAGLVVNKGTGELGALSFSDGKIVLADEFDKVPSEDIDHTLELLSNGKCRVDAGRVHETIESHFTMIALANPIGQVFSSQSKIVDQIGLPPALMSRFALISKAESLVGEELQELVMAKLQMSGEMKGLTKNYDQWAKLARLHQPAMSASKESQKNYSLGIKEIIEKYQSTPLRRDMRMTDYARRIPMSFARSEFRDVTDTDLEKSLHLFRNCFTAWF